MKQSAALFVFVLKLIDAKALAWLMAITIETAMKEKYHFNLHHKLCNLKLITPLEAVWVFAPFKTAPAMHSDALQRSE